NNDYGTTYPALQERYRNGKEYRVFFGPWETYLLKAEAIVRGYISGNAETEYNEGIKASFDYLGMSSLAADYINSENYNRVGTSVKFSHTDEPIDYEIDYYDAVAKAVKKTTYHYPVASKTLYGKALNDQLTKIITQKYIANTPWLPLETWSDHRRTGLPFWEIPVSSTEYNFLDGWTKDSYKNGQKAGYYPGRMNYPAKFNNASPEQYQHALELMGMTDGEKTCTPLWWAKK
ncbi:MAG: SusD/RagB family nutrient-binding outer membrane lipoprotein, partial [Bacteroidales bacterium]|nr:SusD/RagB family nutrient-binding outer membrane lipoprotein [Bacteroidales bacterium]